MSLFGYELAHKPGLSGRVRLYARLFGNPHLGETMRAVAFRSAVKGIDFSGKRVLDAGCGWGPYSYDLARRFPTARVTGVEASPNTVRKNTAIRDALGIPNLDFVPQDLREFEEKDAYDAMLLIDVLEHIPDDAGALRRLSAALRPGGLIYVHVPTDRYRAFFSRKYAYDMDHFPEHVRPGYSPESLRRLAGECGLEVLRSGRGMRYASSLVLEVMGMLPLPNALSVLLAIPAKPLLLLDRLCPSSWGNTSWIVARRPLQGAPVPA